MSTNFLIGQSFCQYPKIKFDTLYYDEPVKPLSGQCPTSQMKVNIDCLELSIEDYANFANIKFVDQSIFNTSNLTVCTVMNW